MTNNQKIRKQIQQLGPWFHNIHLPGGQQTAPDHFLGDFPAFKWRQIKNDIPEDLSGKKILDIGCNAGFYTLKLARRGAHVTAIDLDTNYLEQAKWIIDQFELWDKVTLKQQQVYDLSQEDHRYDIVWFMGVLYHLRYPLLALDIINRITEEMLVIQTLTISGGGEYEEEEDYMLHDRSQMMQPGWPKMAFIEKKFNNDPTNWWFANQSCVEAMLRTSGFQIETSPGKETFICKPDCENPGVHTTWNESEYLSAIQQEWKGAFQKKIQ